MLRKAVSDAIMLLSTTGTQTGPHLIPPVGKCCRRYGSSSVTILLPVNAPIRWWRSYPSTEESPTQSWSQVQVYFSILGIFWILGKSTYKSFVESNSTSSVLFSGNLLEFRGSSIFLLNNKPAAEKSRGSLYPALWSPPQEAVAAPTLSKFICWNNTPAKICTVRKRLYYGYGLTQKENLQQFFFAFILWWQQTILIFIPRKIYPIKWWIKNKFICASIERTCLLGPVLISYASYLSIKTFTMIEIWV